MFLEGKLNKKELETFKKYADKVEEFIRPEKKLTKKEALALKGEKIDFFDKSPENLTHLQIQPHIFNKVLEIIK